MISLIISAFLGGIVAVGFQNLITQKENYQSIEDRQMMRFSSLNSSSDTSQIIVPEGLNFIYAADVVRPAVVHIRVSYQKANYRRNGQEDPMGEMFRQFHDQYVIPSPPQQSSGSGVIITDDGYIATNNHVIDNGGEIEVVLNDKRSFKATIVGTDPSTDLALLKIDAKNLPFVRYGNSDELKIGEWVLAVGNPFDLTSTVTAGIVSAKGRNINLLRDTRGTSNYAIESFIQTDAAVNPGNSGGALVNLKGELIGINTAIASRTGYYAGYSFAVPVQIVKKVMDDLMQYGETQRALLGVQIRDIDANLAKVENIKSLKGVYVVDISKNGAAKEAGLKKGDVITAINGVKVNSTSELQAQIATKRPGDKVEVEYARNGKMLTTKMTLRNKNGGISKIKKVESEKTAILGAEVSPISQTEKNKLGIEHGVKIIKLSKGKLTEAGIKEGFIITYIGERAIYTIEDMAKALKNQKRVIAIEGFYPNGEKAYYAIGW